MESRKILKSIKIKPIKVSTISPADLLSAMKAVARKEQGSQDSQGSREPEPEKKTKS